MTLVSTLPSSAPRPAALAAPAPVPALSPDPSTVEIDASEPFHRVVAAVQEAVRDGVASVWLTGHGAAPVAARVLRLVRDVRVGAELDPAEVGLAEAASDAVVLAGVAGGRAHVLVRDPSARATLRAAVRRLVTRGPVALPSRFGGDAWSATVALSWPVEVVVHPRVAAVLAA